MLLLLMLLLGSSFLSPKHRTLAERIITELGAGFKPKMHPTELTVKMVSRLTQMLKDVKRFKPPDGGCLSPAGEYNLRCRVRSNNRFHFALRFLPEFAVRFD